MKEIHFDAGGPALSINIRYESNQAENLFATYTYTLWAANSNAIIEEHSGNNFNDDDDHYRPPTPVEKNNERVIDVFSILKNAGSQKMKARVVVEVSQGDQLLDSGEDERNIPAKSTDFSEVFIMLIAD